MKYTSARRESHYHLASCLFSPREIRKQSETPSQREQAQWEPQGTLELSLRGAARLVQHWLVRLLPLHTCRRLIRPSRAGSTSQSMSGEIFPFVCDGTVISPVLPALTRTALPQSAGQGPGPVSRCSADPLEELCCSSPCCHQHSSTDSTCSIHTVHSWADASRPCLPAPGPDSHTGTSCHGGVRGRRAAAAQALG